MSRAITLRYKLSAIAMAALSLAGSFTPAPVIASDQVLEPTRCITQGYRLLHYYSWKNPDSLEVKKIGDALFEVTVRKDGKKGIYEFDGCTRQSRKIR